MDVLRYAAGIGAAGYEPGTAERGLLEQFAAGANLGPILRESLLLLKKRLLECAGSHDHAQKCFLVRGP